MILSHALDLDLTATDQATIVGRRQVAAARSVREVAGDLDRAGRSGDAYRARVSAVKLKVGSDTRGAHKLGCYCSSE